MRESVGTSHPGPARRASRRSGPLAALLLVAIAALGLPVRGVARSPAPPICGGSETTQRAAEKRAVALAKRLFPAIAFTVPSRGCRHFGFSMDAPMQVPFGDYELSDPAARVTFRLKEPMGILYDRSPERFLLLPFPSRDALTKTARMLRSHPLIKNAFGSRPLACTADTDAPGSTAYYACTTGQSPPSAIGLEVSGHTPVVKLRQAMDHPDYARRGTLEDLFEKTRRDRAAPRGRRGSADPPRQVPPEPAPLVVTEYSLPVTRLLPKTRAWTEVRMTPEVLAFVAAQPAAIATLAQWHQDYLTLWAPLAPGHNLVVVWSTAYRRGQIPQVIHACRNTKPMDCVFQARRR